MQWTAGDNFYGMLILLIFVVLMYFFASHITNTCIPEYEPFLSVPVHLPYTWASELRDFYYYCFVIIFLFDMWLKLA